MFISEWVWDDGNVEEIWAHRLSPRDIIDVWEGAPKFRRNKKGRAATHQMIGPDRGGRFLAVFICENTVQPGLWRVVTARKAERPECEWWQKS